MCTNRMKEPIVFMFSGHGSQYFQMGRHLYEEEPTFRDKMQQLDRIIQKSARKSIVNYIYDDHRLKSDDFTSFFYAHLSLFMIEVAMTHLLMSKGIRPDAVMGSSMGEYAAGVAADVFCEEDVLLCLIEQARIMEKTGLRGGMIAVLASPGIYHETPILHHYTEIASVNNEGHFIISGMEEGIEIAERYFHQKDISFIKMPVTYPFHSSHMDPVGDDIRKSLAQLSYMTPVIPFYSAVTGREHAQMKAAYFWEVLRKPILFQEALTCLEGKPANLIDLGPSGTLANFARTYFGQAPEISIHSILSPYMNQSKSLESLYGKLSFQNGV